MHILLETGDYRLRNIGDLTMLQIAVHRLGQLYPHATIEVFNSAPELARTLLPNTTTVEPTGHVVWTQAYNLLSGWRRLLPSAWAVRLERGLRQRWPIWSFRRAMRVLKKKWPEAAGALDIYFRAIQRADLVVAAGGGYITDAFIQTASPILETLRLAQRLGKPTALVGQGLGPITEATLLAQLKQVLPHVDLLALREPLLSAKLANQCGAPPQKTLCTGDDAIELAQSDQPELGKALGVNLRLSRYSGVGEQDKTDIVATLVDVLSSLSKALDAPLLATPISRHSEEDDVQSLAQRMKLDPDDLQQAASIYTAPQLVQQISGCRVVVTGSYHAGVFALSQGVPVVALAGSRYYMDKFAGLATQFGEGCQCLALDAPNLADELNKAIRRLWEKSADLRPTLRAAAQKQVALAQHAYQLLAQTVAPDSTSIEQPEPTSEQNPHDPDAIPSISVLMPVYNAERYLREAVQSILDQTERDFELIAVDDGSSDGSLDILQCFARNDARVRIISRANTGIVGALNDALQAARAPLVARMDADDVSMPTRFAKQKQYLAEHPQCVSVGSGAIVTESNGVPLYRWDRPTSHEQIDAMLLSGDGAAIVHPATMTRTAAMRQVGGYRRESQYAEDLDLWLRLAEAGRLANLDEPLLQYRQHLQSINHTRFAQQRTLVERIVREAAARRGVDAPVMATVQWIGPRDRLETWMWATLRAGRPDVARHYAWKRLRMAPWSVRSWKIFGMALWAGCQRNARHQRVPA